MEVHLLGLEWRGNEVTLPSISRGGTLALDPDYDDDDDRYDDNEDPWFLKPGGPRGPNFLAGALWALQWPFMLDFLLALSLQYTDIVPHVTVTKCAFTVVSKQQLNSYPA